jgi:hypothetical protein
MVTLDSTIIDPAIARASYRHDRETFSRCIESLHPIISTTLIAIVDELAAWSFENTRRLTYVPSDGQRLKLRFVTAAGTHIWSIRTSLSSGSDLWIGGRWLAHRSQDLHDKIASALDELASGGAGRPKELLALPLPDLRESTAMARVKELIVAVIEVAEEAAN